MSGTGTVRETVDENTHQTPAPSASRPTSSAAPQPAELTSFVGRSALLQECVDRVREQRLVTLVGTGGVGKTRLLRRLQARLDAEPGTDAVLIRLGPLHEDQVESVIAETLGLAGHLDDNAALAARLGAARLVLMLDNCEHLVDGEPGTGALTVVLSRLLDAAPTLRIVCTSRVRIGIMGEHLVTVPPLRTGSGATATEEGLPDAVRLLVDRANEVGVAIDPVDYPLASRLCQLLDGVPLAIELAAKQLDFMTMSELVRQDNLLNILVDGASDQPHHRTMRANLDWSYDRLGPQEQHMWALLSVFAGGFDLDTAAAAATGQGLDRQQVPGLLAGLRRNSLLLVDQNEGRTRYRLLETARQYGCEQLERLHDAASARRWHAQHYLEQATAAADSWHQPNKLLLLRGVRDDLDNYLAAMDFRLQDPGDDETPLQLAISLSRTGVHLFTGRLVECRNLLERALSAAQPQATAMRISATVLLSWILMCEGDHSAATKAVNNALRLAEKAASADHVPLIDFMLGAASLFLQGKPDDAVAHLENARDAFAARGPSWQSEWVTAAIVHAVACSLLDDENAAHEGTSESVVVLEAADTPGAPCWAWWATALAELSHGSPDEAEELLRRTLRRQYDIGDRYGSVITYEALAWAAAARGKAARAARLLGAASAQQRQIGVDVTGIAPIADRRSTATDLARAALTDEVFTNLYAEGAAITDPGLARELAFDDQPDVLDGTRDDPTSVLTPSQLEVARLVATGMGNDDIAKELVLSKRTIESHVTAILRRLNVRNRRGIMLWIINTLPMQT